MSPSNKKPLGAADEPQEDASESAFKIPSVFTLLHFVWLNKWAIVIAWTLLAIPTGITLSIFNLPRSYSASTVLRFPDVVGAQTNVMRDVAITSGESIISIFNSFQVMEATIRKLSLRLRIETPEVFKRDVFRSIQYSEDLGLGQYTLVIGKDYWASILYKPLGKTEEYVLVKGSIKGTNKVVAPGLELEINEALLARSEGIAILLSFNSLEETAVGLRKSLTTRSLGSSNIEIRIKDRDPWLVADILNTLRIEFLEVYYGTTEVQDVGILVQMEKDLEISKQKLEKSQDELSTYYAAHPELMRRDDAGGGDNLVYLESRQDQERVTRSQQRIQAAFQAKPAEGTAEQVYYWATEMLGTMSEAGEPKANIQRASLQELQLRQTNLRTSLGPDHPRIAEVEAEKANLYVQIEETYRSMNQRLTKESADLRHRMVSNAPSRPVNIPVKVQLELERLNSVNTNNQDIYQRLQESYNRAKLVTGSEFFKVTVVDPARAAIYEPPSFKSRIVVAIGAVMGLAFFVPALFIAWPVVFRKIWTKDDVTKLIGIKLLGAVAWNGASRSQARKSEKAAKKAAKKAGTDKDEDDEPRHSESLARTPDPLLLFVGTSYSLEDLEAYRVIREETESYFRKGAEGKCCLLMTSTRPNEGKTLTACNLAMTFARKGKRTLLIDADFRLGRIDKIFNIPASTGVDELLGQTDMSDEAFRENVSLCFQPTMQRNLVLAPRSRSNPNAGELVSSDRFKSFIKLTRELFDIVIIDTPPIMITPEPLALAEVVDGVLFVCLSGGTAVSDSVEATRILAERGVRVGAILNGVKQSPFAQNRYKKYSYYYQSQPPAGDRTET